MHVPSTFPWSFQVSVVPPPWGVSFQHSHMREHTRKHTHSLSSHAHIQPPSLLTRTQTNTLAPHSHTLKHPLFTHTHAHTLSLALFHTHTPSLALSLTHTLSPNSESSRERRFALLLTYSDRRCRASIAHIRQSRPDSGLGFQVKVLKTF